MTRTGRALLFTALGVGMISPLFVTPSAAVVPAAPYNRVVIGYCEGHRYTITGTFAYNPDNGLRRGLAGRFQGDDATQFIHDFQVGTYSTGGGTLSRTVTVNSIRGYAASTGYWGRAAMVTLYARTYSTLHRCAWSVRA